MMRRHALAALFVIGLSGCVPYYVLAPEGLYDMGAYSISTPIPWSRMQGQPERWTVDGEDLESLLYFNDVGSGQSLFPEIENEALKPFTNDMRFTEMVTLFTESFGVAYGARAFQVTSVAPSNFGSREGFSFDFEYESHRGLPMLGTGKGAVIDGKLQLIVYVGARSHYFAKYKDSVEEMFGSIAFLIY